MYFVLDRILREGDGRVIERIDGRIDALEKRMEAIEGRMDSARKDVRTAMREELKGLSEAVQALQSEMKRRTPAETAKSAQTGRDDEEPDGDAEPETEYYYDQLDPSRHLEGAEAERGEALRQGVPPGGRVAGDGRTPESWVRRQAGGCPGRCADSGARGGAHAGHGDDASPGDVPAERLRLGRGSSDGGWTGLSRRGRCGPGRSFCTSCGES